MMLFSVDRNPLVLPAHNPLRAPLQMKSSYSVFGSRWKARIHGKPPDGKIRVMTRPVLARFVESAPEMVLQGPKECRSWHRTNEQWVPG